MIKQKKCKYCKELFLPKGFNQKNCYKDECISLFYNENKKKIELKSKQNKNKVRKELKESSKGIKELKKYLQDEINLIVRLIDKNQPCICTGSFNGRFDSGHFYSRSECPELSYNLMNIYKQSVHSNKFKHADIHRYREGLERVYGKEHLEYVTSLKGKQKPLHLKEFEYIEYIKICRQIVRELNKKDLVFSTDERLRLRKEYNERIGIYKY